MLLELLDDRHDGEVDYCDNDKLDNDELLLELLELVLDD